MFLAIAPFLKPAGIGAAVGTAITTVAQSLTDGSTSNITLLWGALLGSVGMVGLSILWRAINRTRGIIEFLIDKGFDSVERKIGMEPQDFGENNLKTPMDALLGEDPKKDKDEESDDK